MKTPRLIPALTAAAGLIMASCPEKSTDPEVTTEQQDVREGVQGAVDDAQKLEAEFQDILQKISEAKKTPITVARVKELFDLGMRDFFGPNGEMVPVDDDKTLEVIKQLLQGGVTLDYFLFHSISSEILKCPECITALIDLNRAGLVLECTYSADSVPTSPVLKELTKAKLKEKEYIGTLIAFLNSGAMPKRGAGNECETSSVQAKIIRRLKSEIGSNPQFRDLVVRLGQEGFSPFHENDDGEMFFESLDPDSFGDGEYEAGLKLMRESTEREYPYETNPFNTSWQIPPASTKTPRPRPTPTPPKPEPKPKDDDLVIPI